MPPPGDSWPLPYCGPPSRCASFRLRSRCFNYPEFKGFPYQESEAPSSSAAPTNQGRDTLPGIKLKENESFEGAMKRFKKQCEKAGIMYELRRREHYEKPSVRRKKKALAARKRAIKKLRAAGP